MTQAQRVEDPYERELIDICDECYDDPYAFAMQMFHWGEGDLKDHDGPDVWQAGQQRRIGRKIRKDPNGYRILEAIASGHGIGKGAETAMLIIWAMSTRPFLSGVVTANTKSQLDTKTWRELKKWHNRAYNKHWFKWAATSFRHVDHPEWSVDSIPNTEHNSQSFAGLHGEHVLVIFDEASTIPDGIWEVTDGALTTPRCMWFVFGNPTENTGRFSECFGSKSDRWTHNNIDSRTCKMADTKYLQQLIDDYGEDSDYARVRVKGQFPRQGSTQLISGEVVTNAQKREVQPQSNAVRILTADIARYGDDESVISRVQGRKLYEQIVLRSMDTMTVAQWIGAQIREYDPDLIVIDGVGIGAGVVDRLRQWGFDVQEALTGLPPSTENKDLFFNKRIEMWEDMKSWLETADIPDDPDLFRQLTGITYSYDNRLRKVLERKEDMKKRGMASPDRADSLALAFAFPAPSRRMNKQFFEPQLFEADGMYSAHGYS